MANHIVTMGLLCLALATILASAVEGGGNDLHRELVRKVPDGFTRFRFAGYEKEADLLTHFLWHHFSTRGVNGKTIFNKEYLTIGDLWLSGASDGRRGKTIQAVHREDILGIGIDAEGYVRTHQHFSHAHEDGWPFPIWTQSSNHPDGVAGQTVGWHFQEDGPTWQWVGDYLKSWQRSQYYGESATRGWHLENVESKGIVDGKWLLESTGESPAIVTPVGMEFEAFQSPFLQLRWTRTGEPPQSRLPYVEWLRDGETTFGSDRRVYFDFGSDEWKHLTGANHSMIEMYRHPKWSGKIKRVKICLAPAESGVEFAIDSFFTCYDTRHSINNPIFVLASWNYFRWTGDTDFLRKNINRMRTALRYQQTVMGGLRHRHIRNPWPGHDGIPGWILNPDGSKAFQSGHGIGNNYWDLLPFGWDDMYATAQYYASLLAMAEAEEAVLSHPEWGVPRGSDAFDPSHLRRHAEAVKREANRKFWNDDTGRFIACIDKNGKTYDYGFTFLNLDAIWYGIATEEHAGKIMDWIEGKRIVKGDTSTGEDIYHWRFGPRATTKRNVEWYGQAWSAPESIEWGGQVQDGGAVLGFTFYDLWARLVVRGPDNAWSRLMEILKWEEEVWSEGGYREYYKDGKRGNTLQGCGAPGGLGIDCEFHESILVPSIVTYGFLGLDARADSLVIAPQLPRECPEIGVSGVLYRGTILDISASDGRIAIVLENTPVEPISVIMPGDWVLDGSDAIGSLFRLATAGQYSFRRFDIRQSEEAE